MADRSALGLIGALLGIAVMAVTIVGSVVVAANVSGRLTPEGDLRLVALHPGAR